MHFNFAIFQSFIWCFFDNVYTQNIPPWSIFQFWGYIIWIQKIIFDPLILVTKILMFFLILFISSSNWSWVSSRLLVSSLISLNISSRQLHFANWYLSFHSFWLHSCFLNSSFTIFLIISITDFPLVSCRFGVDGVLFSSWFMVLQALSVCFLYLLHFVLYSA